MRLYERIFKEFGKLKNKGKLILYGSVAEGKSRFDSDIDIAAISNNKKFFEEVENIADKILFKYGKVVSIIKFSFEEFNRNEEPIIKKIKKGKIIYERN